MDDNMEYQWKRHLMYIFDICFHQNIIVLGHRITQNAKRKVVARSVNTNCIQYRETLFPNQISIFEHRQVVHEEFWPIDITITN
jgi:hypothetical protein